MPEKGRLPELERLDNRTKIYNILLNESLTRSVLERQSGFSKSTVANHLNDLLREGAIEKAIENNRMVYRAKLVEEHLLSEMKKQSYEVLIDLLERMAPSVAIIIDLSMNLIVKRYLIDKKRDLDGLTPLTYGEKNEQIEEWIYELLSEQDLKIINKSKIGLIRKDHVEFLKAFVNVRMVEN